MIRKRPAITQEELIADVLFFVIAAAITFIFVFFFDIHRGLYTWPPRLLFVFDSIRPYFLLIPIGTVIGFLLIKLFLYAFKKEEHL